MFSKHKHFPIGLVGETFVHGLIDEKADTIVVVSFTSGGLGLTLRIDQLVDLSEVLDRADDENAEGEWFKVLHHQGSWVVTTHGDVQAAITVENAEELAKLREVIARAREVADA